VFNIKLVNFKKGDSGGPILVGKTQIGLVSWGLGCADPKYPGLFE